MASGKRLPGYASGGTQTAKRRGERVHADGVGGGRLHHMQLHADGLGCRSEHLDTTRERLELRSCGGATVAAAAPRRSARRGALRLEGEFEALELDLERE